MNAVDRAILAVAPAWAMRRARARVMANYFHRAYENAVPTRLRKRARDQGSGNAASMMAIGPLRDYARHLERNHDLARGILGILVRNIVGATGIGVEPQPKDANGEVHDDLAEQLDNLYDKWCERPEVTRSQDMPGMQQLLCRSWVRDGESLYQQVIGYLASLKHTTAVPYSIEMIEADLLPLTLTDPSRNIFQGVERDGWGRSVAFHLYKTHPHDPATFGYPDVKRVSADTIGHIKAVDRIGQVRGVSMYASVLGRLDDVKDYEESERIAAKIAASLAAYIKKNTPDGVNPNDYLNPDGTRKALREMRFDPGMIIDQLMPGEEVGMIDSKRPNVNAVEWRNGQLRATAAGMDVSYSASSKNYDGSYSALRQELVDQYSAYATLSAAFTNMCVRPIYKGFVAAAVQSGQVKIPKGIDPDTIADAVYIAPRIPWIDPQREAQANEVMEDRAWRSAQDVIRSMGAKPRDVARAQAHWLRLKEKLGIPNVLTGRQQQQTLIQDTTDANP
mgnify:CR=1 FL=1